jgi:uridine kinase
MAVENRIVKIQKRNRALVRFDLERIRNAILRAGASIGGFGLDHHPGINDRLFQSCNTPDAIADFLTDAVVVCLNSDPHHLIANFPPSIELIQDEVLHVLRSHGLQHTADAYACYRWCRHWLREGAITPEQFVGNGFPSELVRQKLEWSRAQGCDTVAGLNDLTRRRRLGPLIESSLARYESSLDAVATQMLGRINQGDAIRLMWISGPSSSGKTTTTIKLTERLQRHGLRFLMLNLDDYFWPLVEHPTDWINDRNFETPEALDIQLLNAHLRALLDGETIEKPAFNFKDGHRSGTKPVRLEPGQILLLDCLHGLYPPIAEEIPAAAQFRVYVENIEVLQEGDGSTKRRVPFTDIRMLRRMLRDARHRNHSPLRTILHWHYVRDGELFSIIPLRGLADAVIDGGFAFEPAALKPFFSQNDGMLPTVADFRDYAGFVDARIRFDRISALLDSVTGLTLEQVADTKLIPGDAVTREFTGGSTIRIPHNE